MNRKWLVLFGLSVLMCAGIQGAFQLASWKMGDLNGQVQAAAADGAAQRLAAHECVEMARTQVAGCGGLDVACVTPQAVWVQGCVAQSPDKSWCLKAPSPLAIHQSESFQQGHCQDDVGCRSVVAQAQIGCLR
ncbi:MAG: hypothetical protein GY913_01180 [Proteobacteria bacterium]|nr:hypothetical protein [Pseudomonadota bacterium]MCP4915511.1 hypothetical protein [Pseudomonadota bacterium]